jgi:xanthine dehydrogenase YagR molybdenum-binding subunit
LGTGIRTILQQVAAEALGYPLAKVRVIIGDTERTPYTGNSWGSQTTPSVTPAVRMAAEDAKRQLLNAAAEMLGGVSAAQLVITDGVITVPDGDQRITASEIGAKLGNVTIIGNGSRGPNPAGTGIHTFGAQFAEVEVDIETGVVRVLRIVAAHEAGRILNPTLARSQMEGGIIQGLGYALFEERALDERLGLPLNPGLHDYKIPTMADIPAIDVHFVEGSDTTANHVGARGIAEAPIIPTAPAIANAVADALGVDVSAIPLTPWRVLDALNALPR